jgi:hypothetical protein
LHCRTIIVDVRRSTVNARDAGFALIGRINRWLIAGAVVLSGAISVAAAKSVHGHSTTPASSAAHSSSASSASSSPGTASSSSSGLQQPAQAPSQAPSSPAPVVSGGS